MSDDPVAVLGVGAVGGLLAALLLRDGQPVTAVARTESAGEIRRSGLTVHSALFGQWTSQPDVSEHVPPGARVLLCVKAYALDGAIELLRPARPAVILTVLNGVGHLGSLRAGLPQTQVIPGTVTVEAARLSPTVIEHRSPFVRLAVPDTAMGEPLVSAVQQAGVEVVAGGGESEVLWRKYRFLAPLALLTAYHRTPLGEALARDPALTAAVMAEVAATATAAGLPTSARDLEGILTGLPPTMRSSLQLDLAAGGPSELVALGGGLLAAAAAGSVDAPVCAAIVGSLRAPGAVEADTVRG